MKALDILFSPLNVHKHNACWRILAGCATGGILTIMLTACGDMNPHNVNVELPQSKPQQKVTSYTQALSDLGLMTLIYDPGELKVQSQDISDKTGASATTGAEIQRNITEIMKSTLNSIGGEVTFIEYDPSFIQNQMVTGYGNFENKTVPDVVITGGITEFDRGLETHGEGTNFDVEAQATGLPSWTPSDTIGLGYGDTEKGGKARITLDFNLKNFQTLAGIPKMTTTNSMEVYKGLHEKELGITIFGPTFGLKGSTKKVQGRHEAVRILVQLSMIQMVGKYLAMPYWELLGDDVRPDPVVLDSIRTTYYNMDTQQQVMAVQQWLILHGYNLDLTGDLDSKTKTALKKFDPTFSENGGSISEELFSKIYLTIPVNYESLARRKLLNNMLVDLYNKMEAEAARKTAPPPKPKQVQKQAAQQKAAAPVKKSAPQPAPVQAQTEAPKVQMQPARTPNPTHTKKGLGRKLNDDEW